jgi:hypothetical protein
MMEGNSRMIYLIHCKNFCKCHNVPPPSTTIKKKKNTEKINRTSMIGELSSNLSYIYNWNLKK